MSLVSPPSVMTLCTAHLGKLGLRFWPADSAGAVEVRRKCGVLLKGRHAAERMQRCWGAGAGLRLPETRAAVASMLMVRPTVA